MRRTVGLTLVLVLMTLCGYGQQPTPFTIYDLNLGEGQSVLLAGNPDGTFREQYYKKPPKGGVQELKLIVQLPGDPIAILRGQGKKGQEIIDQYTLLQSRHQGLRDRIDLIEKDLIARRVIKAPVTVYDYDLYFGINAVILTTVPAVADEIRQIPGLPAVEDDREIYAHDLGSVAAINLGDFQMDHPGVTGTGITIGIIDTGIDYLHPDLGGGFGSGFRVIDGWDFVNNDGDPMDDQGHGTHVAGIAAGSSTNVPGVASTASLVAYKVLNQNGGGTFSDAIAAIDRSVDPDQNILTDDHLDVINLSLGGPGNANDLASQACDNAFAAGVFVIASAGNSGSSYFTVGSPGTARDAFTVANANNNGNMTASSSRGPGSVVYNMKPDITAPGTGINAPYLGGTYATLTGTSMSAPHVAGAAALLRELFPGRTPGELKSMMMQEAVDLSVDLWTQGAGMLDLSDAAAPGMAVYPMQGSNGLADCNQSIWTNDITYTVYNYGATTVNYAIALTNVNTPNGATFTPSTSSLSVPAGGSNTFTVTLTVNTAIVPANSGNPGSYQTDMSITGGGNTVTVPMTFFGNQSFVLNLNSNPTRVDIHDGNSWVYSMVNPPPVVTPALAPGLYDLIVTYGGGDRIVIREDVQLGQCATPITIAPWMAQHQWEIFQVDNNGAPLPVTEYGSRVLLHKSSGLHLSMAGYFTNGSTPELLHFSTFSSDYEWQATSIEFTGTGNTTNYVFPMRLSNGVSGPGNFYFNSNDFMSETKTYDEIPSSVTSIQADKFVPLVFTNWAINPQIFIANDIPAVFSPNTGSTTTYYAPALGSDWMCGWFKERTRDHGNGGSLGSVLYDGSLVQQRNLNELSYYQFSEKDDYVYRSKLQHTDVAVGIGAPRWNGRTWFLAPNPPVMDLQTNTQPVQGYFHDQFGNVRTMNTPYQIRDGIGTVLATGFQTNDLGGGLDYLAQMTTAGDYVVEYTFANYNIGGQQGVVTATMSTHTLNSNVPNCPSLPIFATRSDGVPSEVLPDNADNEIVFRINDEFPGVDFLECVTLEIRSPNSSMGWLEMPLNYDATDDVYYSKLPCNLGAVPHDVRITAVREDGGMLEYTAEPGFTVVNTSAQPEDFASGYEGGDAGMFLTRSETDVNQNTVVVGSFQGTITLDNASYTANGVRDGYIVKYDHNGNELWSHTVSGPGLDNCIDVVMDKLGNVYVTGRFEGSTILFNQIQLSSFGPRDGFVAKLLPDGTLDWWKTTGGAGNETAYAVDVDDEGDVYWAGQFDAGMAVQNLTLTNAGLTAFMCKLNVNGNVVWLQAEDATGTSRSARLKVRNNGTVLLLLEFTGDYTVGGVTHTNAQGTDLAVVNFLPNGTAMWSRIWENTSVMIGTALDESPQSRVLVGGWYWGNLTANGTTYPLQGGQDFFIGTLQTNTNHFWTRRFGDFGDSHLGDAEYEPGGSVYFTGSQKGSLNFSHTTPVWQHVQNAASEQAFIARYSGSGNFAFAKAIESNNAQATRGEDLEVDDFRGVTLTGNYTGTLNAGSVSLPGNGGDLYVLRHEVDCPATAWNGFKQAPVEEGTENPAIVELTPASPLEVTAFPVPFADKLNVKIQSQGAAPVVLELFDLVGHRIALVELPAGAQQHSFGEEALKGASGMLLLRVRSGEETVTQKVLRTR